MVLFFLHPGCSFSYPWFPAVGLIIVLAPDPGFTVARDPTYATRRAKKYSKWLRHNRRFLCTGFGRFRPIFYPPPAPARLDWGARVVLRVCDVCLFGVSVISHLVLMLLGDPLLLSIAWFVVSFGRFFVASSRLWVTTSTRLWSRVFQRFPPRMLSRLSSWPRSHRLVWILLWALFCLWYAPDVMWLTPFLPPSHAFLPPARIYSTRVAGVHVITHDIRSAKLASPDHFDAAWLLDEDYLSEVELNVGGDLAEDPAVIRTKLDAKLSEARSSGISPRGFRQLRRLIYRHLDAFGDTLHGCHLSKLTPMDVKLKPGATPCIARARTFGPAAEAYLADKLRTLEKIGVISPVKDSTWSSAVFVVPKQLIAATTDLGSCLYPRFCCILVCLTP